MWGASLAFVVDAIVTVIVTYMTKPKPIEELQGLVYGMANDDEQRARSTRGGSHRSCIGVRRARRRRHPDPRLLVGGETCLTRTTRAERAANLFDLRRIIGGVFTAWGVLLIILGLFDSQAEIDKAAGVNINLYAGIGMLIFGLLFLLWAFTRPLGQELRRVRAGEQQRGERRRGHPPAGRLRGVAARAPNRRSRRRPSGRRRLRRPSGARRSPRPRARTPRSRRAARRATRRAGGATVSEVVGVERARPWRRRGRSR